MPLPCALDFLSIAGSIPLVFKASMHCHTESKKKKNYPVYRCGTNLDFTVKIKIKINEEEEKASRQTLSSDICKL